LWLAYCIISAVWYLIRYTVVRMILIVSHH
jgi:hypothetical protein